MASNLFFFSIQVDATELRNRKGLLFGCSTLESPAWGLEASAPTGVLATWASSTIQANVNVGVSHFQEVERAFSEFHRMYERNRAAAEGLHKNEEALKKAMAAYQERLQQEQHKYETLKLHAAQKLEG